MNKSPTNPSDDLFARRSAEILKKNAPLADRMRPRNLDEYIGQKHILGEGRLLRRAIQADQLSSLIFYGPPGTGKTTLARIIANTTKAQFISINAVLAGVKEIREAIDQAQQSLSLYGRRTILFVDEVHRFNKAQQDALLPHVENGVLILIGATTENPYFEVNKALVSRSRIFRLESLTSIDLREVALQAIGDGERGYGTRNVRINDDALEHLVQVAGGDARGVLNALELAVETTAPSEDGTLCLTREIIEDSIQQRAVLYDKDGDAHYDIISAFIKSLRGSDPDAALYWMAKMVYAGENPRFIFRRMIISACEDVGMADPQALGVVMDAAQAFDYVGLPEGRYHLTHACLYLATAPKSNSSMAFFDALAAVGSEEKEDVPDHLRDASRDKEGFGHGEGYLYPHAYRDHWVAQQYLPESLQGRLFYQPSNMGYEKKVAEKVAGLREARIEAMVENDDDAPLTSINSKDAPGGKSVQKEWMERSLSGRGDALGELRQKLLDMAELQPTDLVLDVYTRTGLLALAAARSVREGGVWALAHSEESLLTTRQMASRLELLSQPVVLKTSWESFENDIRAAAGKKVKFTKAIGRDILTSRSDKLGLIVRVAGLLDHAGALFLAERIPSATGRFSEMSELAGMTDDLRKALESAETKLYAAPDDPLVNWTADSLLGEVASVTWLTSVTEVQKSIGTRLVRPPDIEHWFRVAANGERPSLGDHLRNGTNARDVDVLRQKLHAAFDYRQIRWESETLFLHLKKCGEPDDN